MLIIVNKREVMGDRVNGRLGNAVGWTTAAALMGMNALFFAMPFLRR